MTLSDSNLRHRLTAILMADAAGYSRLIAADAQATLVALDAARAIFMQRTEANAGRVRDNAGDSVLAVFDTAVGAVRAALEIQRALDESHSSISEDRRLRFRIGVHIGDVIEKLDGTVYGDGVNIAARLQVLAEIGGVAISESVRVAVKGRVAARFVDLGLQVMKNIEEPVHTYLLQPVSTNGDGTEIAHAAVRGGIRIFV